MVQLSGVEKKLFAEEVFDLSFKTIQRYSKEKKDFGARHTELALKLVFLYMKGKEVFGNLESFNRWLRKPAYGLNKKIPYNLINTVTGIDLINDELLRIEFGDLA